MVCNKCKRTINDDTRFCPWCGNKVWIQIEESKPDNETVIINATPKANVQTLRYEEAISVKEWVVTLLIMMIPVVNIVMLFVWAFSGKEKKSKSNYFKSALIMSGIAFAFVIVLLVITFVFASTTYNQISQDYLKDNNTLVNTYDEYENYDNYDNDYNNYNYDENYYDSDNEESYNEEDYYNEDENYEDYYSSDEDYEDYENYEDYEEDNSELNYEYILPNSDSEKLTDEVVSSLSKSDIRLAINEIYARHGRRFGDESLQEYFDEKEWYIGTIDAENFDEGVFNKIEKYNIRLLSKYR